jgi:hypothetical protein
MLLLSCSSAPAAPPPPERIPAGDYTLRAYLSREPVGTCDWVQRGLQTSVSVDAAGQVESPLPGASCTTTYADWVNIVCSGFGARMTAHGTLELSGAQGSGEIRGNIGGCTELAFTFQLVRR